MNVSGERRRLRLYRIRWRRRLKEMETEMLEEVLEKVEEEG